VHYRLLVDGVTVEYRDGDGTIRGAQARVIHFDDPTNNDWLAVNQFTVVENKHSRRPDVVLFVNGLPLALLELKNAANEDATIWSAFHQLQTYKAEIPAFFAANAVLVVSDGIEARIGTVSAGREWFKPWRTIEGEGLADTCLPELRVVIEGVFEPRRFLDLVRDFLVFEDDGSGRIAKKMAGYHQFHAVQVAVRETLRAAELRAGARPARPALTLVRPDPGERYRTQVPLVPLEAAAGAFGDPQHLPPDEELEWVAVHSRRRLRPGMFAARVTGRSMEPRIPDGALCLFSAPVEGTRQGKTVLVELRDATDPDTGERYTVKRYESQKTASDEGSWRHARITLRPVNSEFQPIVLTPQQSERLQVVAELVEVLLETPADDSKAGDRRIGVVWHTQGSGKSLTMAFYAGRIIRERALENPTIVVLTDRNDLDDQLFATFSRCVELVRQPPLQAASRAHLRELLSVAAGGVVFTTIHKFFPEEKGDRHPTLSDRRNIVVIADEAHRSQYDFIDGFARHMRDALPHASFIGFTGTPIELADANTRAVFGDYISVYDVQRAVEDGATVPIYYESRLAKLALDEAERPRIDPDFEEATAGEEVERKEKLKTKWAQLEAIVGAEKRLRLVARDIVQHFEERLEALAGKAMVVCMSRRICVELYREIVKLRPAWASDDVAFFQAVQAVLAKRAPGEARPEEELDHAVRQIISRAVAPEGVVDIFAAAGLVKPDISIVSDEFLAEVRGMPQRNLAIELLQKLLKGEIGARRRKNVIQARSFAEMLEQNIRRYQNRAIEAAQVIEELIALARDMREANARGEALGLSEDELAFYDALETNDSAVKVLGDETLRAIARELVETVRKNVTIDWTLRENIRAQLRVLVKRILRKHGYPPDKQERATQTVLAQAELLSQEWLAA